MGMFRRRHDAERQSSTTPEDVQDVARRVAAAADELDDALAQLRRHAVTEQQQPRPGRNPR